MNDYLAQLKKMIELSRDDADGILIVNKEGYVEYYKNYDLQVNEKFCGSERKAVGKHVLDMYPELNEENSTVMETLRTGKTMIGKKQTFTWGDYKLTVMTVTYPILENGEVQGAIDIGKVLQLTDTNASDSEAHLLYVVEDIITQDEEMERLKERIYKVAESESSVLIYGETGTGKELVAESLHMAGSRRRKPFMSQNCAAIPSELLESIFFGTEKGGFTGAESRKGIFELADGGTLFLDEINSMDLPMQAKLLKAIEEKRVRRIGGSEDIFFDARIVCATNEDPDELVEAKRLRADLYYRIGVIKMEVPPLRERTADVKLLTDWFIQKYNKKMNRKIQGLSQMTEQLFERWHWPGNVRELKNTIESAFNLEQSEWITIGSVQNLLKRAEQGERGIRIAASGQAKTFYCQEALEDTLGRGQIDLKQVLEDYERSILTVTLEHEGQLKRAAQKLSMSPQKLQYRMERLGLRVKGNEIASNRQQSKKSDLKSKKID